MPVKFPLAIIVSLALVLSLVGEPVNKPDLPVVGPADVSQASLNRTWLQQQQSNGPVALPAGRFVIDRALAPETGATIRGRGRDKTRLVNLYTPAPYWSNQTVAAQGSGVGYQDNYRAEADKATITLLPGGYPITCYAPGAVAYFWRWNGWWFPDGKGTGPTRLRVKACDPATGQVTFDGTVPTGDFAGGLKWLDGAPIRDCREGDGSVTVAPADAAGFTVGQDVLVTDGPILANEAAGEFRRVVAVNTTNGLVTLDRPLRRGFRQATLARIRPVADVTLLDLTVEQPVNGSAEAVLFKFATRLRLERVRVAGPLSLASCWDVDLVDCEATGLALNNCHDVRVIGGRYGSLWGEEGVHDVTFDGCRVVCSPLAWEGQNGIAQGQEGGCERWTLKGLRVEGFPNSPIGIAGRENVVTDVTVAGSRAVAQPGYLYLQGDGLVVRGLQSDRPVVFHNGNGQSLVQVKAPNVHLGWVNGSPTGGVAVGLSSPVVNQWQAGKWQVIP